MFCELVVFIDQTASNGFDIPEQIQLVKDLLLGIDSQFVLTLPVFEKALRTLFSSGTGTGMNHMMISITTTPSIHPFL